MQGVKLSRTVSDVSARQVPLFIRVGAGEKVTLTGDFTGWSQEGIAMKSLGKGRFRTMLKLAPGSYQYRLLVDGQWTNDLDNPAQVSNPFGTENSVLQVT